MVTIASTIVLTLQQVSNPNFLSDDLNYRFMPLLSKKSALKALKKFEYVDNILCIQNNQITFGFLNSLTFQLIHQLK